MVTYIHRLSWSGRPRTKLGLCGSIILLSPKIPEVFCLSGTHLQLFKYNHTRETKKSPWWSSILVKCLFWLTQHFQINKYLPSSPDIFFILATLSLASKLKCCNNVQLQQVYFCFAKPTWMIQTPNKSHQLLNFWLCLNDKFMKNCVTNIKTLK